MRRSASIIVTGSFALLAACGQEVRYRESVARDLLDPNSAQFRDTRVVDLYSDAGSRVRVYCGEINAKNGLGAYSGFRRFFYVADRTDSKEVERRWPGRLIYKKGDTLYAEGNAGVYRQYCELPAGKRTDDELWINE